MSTSVDTGFLNRVEEAFSASNKDFARAYYLFATARLSEAYNSQEIFERYPLLSQKETVDQLKALLDVPPVGGSPADNAIDSDIKRFYVSTVSAYVDAQLAEQSDAFENDKHALKIDVQNLGLKTPEGEAIAELLYEDVAGWLKKTPDKALRQALYDRMASAWTSFLADRFVDLFQQENTLLANLGYEDAIAFYSWSSGHNLRALGEQGKKLLAETQADYERLMSAHYHCRTGLDFAKDATRSDISYVLHGPSTEMADINARFPSSTLLPLAKKTFDGLGLQFAQLASEVDFANRDDYEREIVAKTEAVSKTGETLQRILLDVAPRSGKPSRAYVYPAAVPSEIYLSVKPEGGLDDYLSFFHEAGHAQHFAYVAPTVAFPRALLGNNTVTETYAYLFQNLFLNRHWLEHKAGLSAGEAAQVVVRRALEDLYMLRRYASKMQFELLLYDNESAGDSGGNDAANAEKGSKYQTLLSEGTGFRYDAAGWTRDVDARFYVADYFTAWSLEAQLRETLTKRFGSPAVDGEDWYLNPEAGRFLKELWAEGSPSQSELSQKLGYDNPAELAPLLRFMQKNLFL